MSSLSPQNQTRARRYLNRLRGGKTSEPAGGETYSDPGIFSRPAFLLLFGFAVLKDILDLFFDILRASGEALYSASWVVWMLEWLIPATKIKYLKFVINGLKWLSPSEWIAEVGQERITAGFILPVIFEIMFMVGVFATLLLSNMTVGKSLKILLKPRTIALSFLGFIAEIIPGLNIMSWATFYVIGLYFLVKSELKKQAAEESAEQAPSYAYADNYPEEERAHAQGTEPAEVAPAEPETPQRLPGYARADGYDAADVPEYRKAA